MPQNPILKALKHIWRYLTSPTYRFWCDIEWQQEMRETLLNTAIDNQVLTSIKMFDNK